MLMPVCIHAQLSDRPQAFEVASIRANHSGERIMQFKPERGGRFTATNCSLALIIQYAYDVMQSHIYRAPDWVKSDRYDLVASSGHDVPIDDLHTMLRALLEDRFQLKSHWRTKEAAAYQLVVSKPGRLHRETQAADCPSILDGPRPESPPRDAPCGNLRNSPGHAKGYWLTAQDLAGSLSFFLQVPVLDKTGLPGKYNIDLQWTPETTRMQGSTPSDTAAPSIFTALQEQLGLKLVSAKTPVHMLVIDQVDRPSEN
jgi:uncharacterized protein (TIGR03435 family)